MIVTLDGRKLDAHVAAPTLRALIDHVSTQHCGRRLIVAISTDGEPLGCEALDVRLDAALDGVSQVDLESADRGETAGDALRALAEQVAESGRTLESLAGLLSEGSAADAIRGVGETIGIWQHCCDALEQCSSILGRDLTAVEILGQPMRSHVTTLARQLRELRDTLENRDLVLLGDLLQFELPPLCQKWQELLRAVADDVERAG